MRLETVQKVFHFDSPAEAYTADACVITCFDARFDLAVKKFLKRRGIVLFDHVKIAGSAKPLADSQASGNDGCGCIMNAVRTSMRLHRTSRVLIMSHNECGAYPGVPPDQVAADAARAAAFLRAAEPSLQVESYFVDFDGVYRVE
jgi:carbonic anhydrase